MSLKNKATTALLAALAGTMLPLAVQAQTALLNDTDYTDVWWNPQRSGWGMNLVQQQNAAYVSLHDYKADGKSTWYVAPLARRTDGSFAGEVYRHASAPVSAPLTASHVSGTPIGTFVFTPVSPTQGKIAYTIDGQHDEQTVTRFVFVAEPFEFHRTWNNYLTLWQTSCSGPGFGGNPEAPSLFNGASSGSAPSFTREWDISITMGWVLGESGCSLSGTFIQDGRFGRLDNASLACGGSWFSMPKLTPVQVTLESSPSRLEIRWTTDEAPASSFLLSQEGTCSQKGKAVFVSYPD